MVPDILHYSPQGSTFTYVRGIDTDGSIDGLAKSLRPLIETIQSTGHDTRADCHRHQGQAARDRLMTQLGRLESTG